MDRLRNDRSKQNGWVSGPRRTGRTFIVKNDTDEPVGTAGFVNPFTIPALWRALEIWYQVHPQARSQGFATQATCLLVNHLFSTRPLERIQATVVVGNDPSCRVLENAGMQRDGVYRNVFFLHGSYVDMHLYSIVRSDWLDETSYRKSRGPF